MFSPINFATTTALLWLLVSYHSSAAKSEELRFDADKEGVSIFDNDTLVVRYQGLTQSLNGQWGRANYLHPVVTPSGKLVTEDFPVDHRHHRGIFWAWHQAWMGTQKLGDAWACNNFTWKLKSNRTFHDGDGITISNHVIWETKHHGQDDPNVKTSPETANLSNNKSSRLQIVSERNQIHIGSLINGVRAIDFSISLLALQDEIQIGGSENEKGYGGFSARIALDGSETFTSDHTKITPITKAITAGTWMDISRHDSGVTIINHQENPGVSENKSDWIVRVKRSMQNAKYPGRHRITLSQEKPLEMRYRVVLHDGNCGSEAIDELEKQFNSITSRRSH